MNTVSTFPEKTIAQTICLKNEISSARLGHWGAHPSVDPIAAVGPGRRARLLLIQGTAMWAAVLAGRRALGLLGRVRVGIRLVRRLWGVGVVSRDMIVLKEDVSEYSQIVDGNWEYEPFADWLSRRIHHCYYGDSSFDRDVVYCDLFDQAG